jgi:hypothetical protein
VVSVLAVDRWAIVRLSLMPAIAVAALHAQESIAPAR